MAQILRPGKGGICRAKLPKMECSAIKCRCIYVCHPDDLEYDKHRKEEYGLCPECTARSYIIGEVFADDYPDVVPEDNDELDEIPNF